MIKNLLCILLTKTIKFYFYFLIIFKIYKNLRIPKEISDFDYPTVICVMRNMNDAKNDTIRMTSWLADFL